MADYLSMDETEKMDIDALIMKLKNRIIEKDDSVTGFNIGTNIGKSAGQTIFHAHMHLIPRRDGDIPNPRGGVRGVIPEKMSYWEKEKEVVANYDHLTNLKHYEKKIGYTKEGQTKYG